MKPVSLKTAKILRRVIRRITEEPKRFEMTFWLGKKIGRGAPSCGTVGCIAGWIALDKYSVGQIRKLDLESIDRIEMNAEAFAADYLDLDWETSGKLFYLGNWPQEFEKKFTKARSKTKKATIAADRIRHFIKTRE